MEHFNKPWMDKCNQDLILRFWRKKGSPGTLTIVLHGISVAVVRLPFGEFWSIKRD